MHNFQENNNGKTHFGRLIFSGRLTLFSVATEWLIVFTWVSFTWVHLSRDWPEIHVGFFFQLAGWPLFILGMLGMLFSLGWLGLRRSHGLDASTLIRPGPYRFTRNPQITSFGAGMLGFLMLWPSWHILVSLMLYFTLAHTMVITEEEHLLDRYGTAYQDYCREIPRYWSP